MAGQEDAGRARANFAALAVVAVLLVGGYFLVQAAVKNARLQECLARGYANCVPVEAPPDRD
jgi:hypothetical protein